MKIPIPIFTLQDNVYDDIEICKPKASVIADTNKAIQSDEVFHAMKVFIAGCTTSIKNSSGSAPEITEPQRIKSLISLLPYRSAEYIAMKIMVLYDEEKDAVEGLYSCPRCGKVIKCEYIKNEDYEMDTRDYISSCNVNFMEEPKKTFFIELTEPVTIKNAKTDEVLFSLSKLELHHPTLNDCSIAERQYGDSDVIRLQFAVYVQALESINDQPVEKKWKNMHGVYAFENIKEARIDLGNLNNAIEQYGMDLFVTKICTNSQCRKEWKAPLSLSSFFVSGLAQ